LYRYDAPTLVDLVFRESRASKAKDWIIESQEILKLLKENLQTVQNRQKISMDRHRIERIFEVGDLVFLRLQPCRQSSLKKNGAEKLKPRFYGPYRIMRRVGEVAYELELLEGRKIHNMFHVSCLKKEVGQFINTSKELPLLDEEGQLELVPKEGFGVLGAETKKHGHQRVFDQMERASSRGRYLGERAGVVAPWTSIA
jgi:hypothetical protein